MMSKTWIAAGAIDAPSVSAVNLQVRTGMSVPFAPHMLAAAGAPAVEPVNLQVRTGMSVPFASFMTGTQPATSAAPVATAATTTAKRA